MQKIDDEEEDIEYIFYYSFIMTFLKFYVLKI